MPTWAVKAQWRRELKRAQLSPAGISRQQCQQKKCFWGKLTTRPWSSAAIPGKPIPEMSVKFYFWENQGKKRGAYVAPDKTQPN